MAAVPPTVTYIKYNGSLLLRGTKGFELCVADKYAELEAHLKQLDAAHQKIKEGKKDETN